MATRKITITLDEDQVDAIRALVGAGRAANISAFVKHAVNVVLSMRRDGEKCWMTRCDRPAAL
jgi:Arc/MetJ-type ribon-helix-helix transcriptional regulator